MKTVCFMLLGLMLSVACLADQVLFSDDTFEGFWARDNYTGTAGFKFIMGNESRWVHELGFIDLGDDGLAVVHRIRIWDEETGAQLAEAMVPAGTGSTKIGLWRYAPIDGGSILLEANKAYVLGAEVFSGSGDLWYDAGGEVVPNDFYSGIQASNTWEIRWGSFETKPSDTAGWGLGRSYGAPNMLTRESLRAHDPNPYDGQANYGDVYDATAVEVMLSWSTALDPETLVGPNPAITDHYLYILEGDPNISYTEPDYVIDTGDPVQAAANIALYLHYGTTYYWRVDQSVNGSSPTDPNTIGGTVWSFSTLPTIPVIVDQTMDVLVAPGDTGQFIVEVSSVSPVMFQWYKCLGTGPAFDAETGLPLDTPVGDQVGPVFGKPASDTLEMANAQIDDEGYYYCQIWNAGGVENAVYSTAARLVTERLAGHWKLNGNLADATGAGWMGTVAESAALVFAEGIDDQAVVMVNDPNHIYIDGSNEAFNFHHLGLTVSAWVKSETPKWSGVVSKQNRQTTPWSGWMLGTNWQGYPYFVIRNVSDSGYYPVNVADGEWHLLTGIYDAVEGVAYLYVDGEPATQDATPYTDDPMFELPDKPVVIGAEQDDGNTPYAGLIDDVRIYTYPISALDIAKQYVAFETDAKICMEYPAGDLNQDCRVDILDLAILASHWLDCNIVPDCIE